MGYLKTRTPQGPDQDIVEDIGPQVPDMSVVIHRGAAAVKTRFPRLTGFKGLCPSAKGIIEGKRHGTSGIFLIYYSEYVQAM
jgi:hypothetical protein